MLEADNLKALKADNLKLLILTLAEHDQICILLSYIDIGAFHSWIEFSYYHYFPHFSKNVLSKFI